MTRLQPTNVSRAGDASQRHNEIVLDGERFVLDAQGAEFMRGVLNVLEGGDDVAIATTGGMLSTQQAADLLGVSRPSLVKLLDQGVIPSHRPGAHRRVRRADIDAFLANADERRARALRELHATHAPEDDPHEGFVSTR